jgi:hypothetical protein
MAGRGRLVTGMQILSLRRDDPFSREAFRIASARVEFRIDTGAMPSAVLRRRNFKKVLDDRRLDAAWPRQQKLGH